MPIANDNVSVSLFEFLRSRIQNIDTLDVDGNPTADEEQIKVFGFEYEDNGVPLGNVTITILDDERSDKSLKIYYGKDLSNLTDKNQRSHFFDFLLDLRRFAKSKLLGFDIRDITKQQLTKRDLAPILGDKEDAVVESKFSKLAGTVKTSVQTLENAKLVIKHSDRVNEEVQGARSRRIHKIYIINQNNERFLMPFTHLGCGRAMAQHVNQGGNPYDNYGVEISNLAQESRELGKFIRRTKDKIYEGENATDLVEAAKCRYTEARTLIKRLQSDRGYKACKEQLLTAEELPEELTNEEFTTKNYDQQLESALPYVWRAYKMNKQVKEASALEAWANEVTGEEQLNEIEMGQTSGGDIGSIGDLVKDPKTGKLTVSLKKQDPAKDVNALQKAIGSQVDVKLAASADEPMAGEPVESLEDRLTQIAETIKMLKEKLRANPEAKDSKGRPFSQALDNWTRDFDALKESIPGYDVEEIDDIEIRDVNNGYDVEEIDDIEMSPVKQEFVAEKARKIDAFDKEKFDKEVKEFDKKMIAQKALGRNCQIKIPLGGKITKKQKNKQILGFIWELIRTMPVLQGAQVEFDYPEYVGLPYKISRTLSPEFVDTVQDYTAEAKRKPKADWVARVLYRLAELDESKDIREEFAKVPDFDNEIPEMIRVDIGQGWQRRISKAVSKVLGQGTIDRQGYSDSSSTTWAVIAYNDPKKTIRQIDDELRKVLGGGDDDGDYMDGGEFGGWLKIEPWDDTQEIGEARKAKVSITTDEDDFDTDTNRIVDVGNEFDDDDSDSLDDFRHLSGLDRYNEGRKPKVVAKDDNDDNDEDDDNDADTRRIIDVGFDDDNSDDDLDDIRRLSGNWDQYNEALGSKKK